MGKQSTGSPQLLPHCKYIKKYYQTDTSDSDSKYSGHGTLRKQCAMEYRVKGECSGHLEEGGKVTIHEHGTHFHLLRSSSLLACQ